MEYDVVDELGNLLLIIDLTWGDLWNLKREMPNRGVLISVGFKTIIVHS